MKKKNSIFTLLLLFAFVSLCYLSVSYVKTNVGSDEKQKNIAPNILSTPKSSGYDVTEKWNYTSDFEVNSVAVSADGRYVAVGVNRIDRRDGDPTHSIFFFNTSDHDGIPLWSWFYDSPINSLAISADGRYIIAAVGQSMAFLFNSTVPEPGESKEYIWKVNWGIIGGNLNSVDISEDGKNIVLAGFVEIPGRIELYNNSYASGFDKTGEFLWYYNTVFRVSSVAISADGKYVAVGTWYPMPRVAVPTIFFLNTTDYILGALQMPMWSFDAGCSIDSIAISADGSYIVAGSDLGAIAYLFNSTVPEPGEDKMEVWYYDWGEYISPVDISADGKTIVIGSTDRENCYVNVYNNSYASSGPDKTDEFLWRYETPDVVNSVAISADGKYIVVGTDYIDNEDTIFLFNNTDIYGEEEHDPEWSFNTTGNDINSVSMSAWGNYIAAGGEYGINGRTYLFYHARPIPRIFYGNGGGGGGSDDDGEEAIPFGNSYLLFTAIAVASLVIITKRKAIFSKK